MDAAIPVAQGVSGSPDVGTAAINTIRALCIGAMERADAGHPGTPTAAVPVVYTLWQHFLRFDPAEPIWPNRDRFVLSQGNASVLLWSLLHLSGVKAVGPDHEILDRAAVTLDDLKTYRQFGSPDLGHRQNRWTDGVEATNGTLGQGLATSVGIALAGRWLAERYNQNAMTLFDFDVYALAGDGCMIDGASGEAASLAGHRRLANLCWIYDSTRLTVEGHPDITFTADVAARFIAYGWNVTTVADADDINSIAQALRKFKFESDRPTLIMVHSCIGYGLPVRDSPKAHGSADGVDDVPATKRFLGLDTDADFRVPIDVYNSFAAGISSRGHMARQAWETTFGRYRNAFPDLAEEIDRIRRRELPATWDNAPPTFPPDPKGLATHDASGQVLNALTRAVPWLVDGSASLSPPPKGPLVFGDAGDFRPRRSLRLGIREHAWAAIANGVALTKLRPYWSGSMTLSDCARAAILDSVLTKTPAVHILTHESNGLGEGPLTHLPAEQLARLRAIPGLLVFCPADANEVAEMWRFVTALRHEPAALILSRQLSPTLDRTRFAPASGLARGGYVLAEGRRPSRPTWCRDGGTPDIILLATGSEVHLALAAREQLQAEGISTRVVSMPCWELFDRQSRQYRDEVLPPSVTARVAVEHASTPGWDRYVGDDGAVVGMRTFGASAPLTDPRVKFGFTPDRVAQIACNRLAAVRRR